MFPIRLAVISDLHVGHGARATDLCPHSDTTALDTGYADTFLRFIRRTKLVADYLVLPGDVSHTAQRSEFALASAVVDRVGRALNVQADRLIFVPGNHDVDWSRAQASDPPDVKLQLKYLNLRTDSLVFEQIMSRGNRHLLEYPHFSVWSFESLLAVGYNSAWDDEAGREPHHGLVAQQHIEELHEVLLRLSRNDDQVRFFLVHHHPILYSDPLPDEPDFSAMVNSPNLLALLDQHRFDLLIHGHKHCPRFQTQPPGTKNPLPVLCAGSFSAHLDTRWSGIVNNQFHLVTITGRDPGSRTVCGLVESWTYLCGRGWIPSQQGNGIRHRIPFGVHLRPHELAQRVTPIVLEVIRTRKYAMWADVTTRQPELDNLPPEDAVALFQSLAHELGCRLVGTEPEEMVLLAQETQNGH